MSEGKGSKKGVLGKTPKKRGKLLKESLKIANQLKQQFDDTRVGNKIDAQQGPQAEQGEEVIAGDFPRDFFTRDPYDDIIRVKKGLASDRRPAPITDKEVKAWLQKEQQAEVLKFEQFFAEHYAHNLTPHTPAELRWAQDIMPDFWKQREAKIHQQSELQLRLALINLWGPQSKEDLLLLHGIQRGEVRVPQKPLHRLGEEAEAYRESLKRGWYSPMSKRIGDAKLVGPKSWASLAANVDAAGFAGDHDPAALQAQY